MTIQKKRGQDLSLTIGGNTSQLIANVKKNPNTNKIESTSLADAAAGYETSQSGTKELEITFDLMHPADGESDDVYTAIMAAIDADTTVDVVFDGSTYNDMSVFEGETSYEKNQIVKTAITLRLTGAPSGS